MSNSIRILYFDVNPPDREIVRNTLQNYSQKQIQLTEATDREEFERLLEQGGFDLILSDINILEFDDLQVQNKVRVRYADLPVVIVTGADSEGVALNSLSRGVHDYVIKSPRQILKLPAAIESVLQRQQLIKEKQQTEQLLRQQLLETEKARQSTQLALEQLERSRHNIELAKKEWESTIDVVTDPVFLHDKNGRIIRVNRAYAEHAGMHMHEIIGQLYWQVFPKLDGPMSGCIHTSDEPGPESVEEEITLDNKETYVTRRYVLHDDEGRYLYSVHFMRDITQRKLAEKALLKSEQRLSRIIENNPYGIMVVDRDGIITFVNAAAESLYDIKAEQLVGLPFGFPLTSGGAVEIDLAHKDGSVAQVEMRVTDNPDDESDEITVLFRDITSQRLAERDLKASLEGTIRVISRAGEVRDPYTSGHQQRVSELAVAIGRYMGLDEHVIEGINMGGIIHDIGKIYLPAEILSKPSRLTSLEYKLIQTHSEVGYDILKGVTFPWPVADIAFQHHERIDGSGYPQGLKGEQICLEAKIVAVADVVEAMASHRPYRAALGIDMALEEIQSQSGYSLDAEVVRACVNLFREGHFSWSSSA